MAFRLEPRRRSAAIVRRLISGTVISLSFVVVSSGSAQVAMQAVTPQALEQVSAQKVYLQAGILDARAAAPESLAQLSAKATARDRFVIQLDGPMTPARRQTLTRVGLTIHDYLPVNAYIVSMTPGRAIDNAAVPFVRWQAPFDASWKLSPEIGSRTFVTPARQKMAANGKVGLIVTLFDGFDEQDVLDQLAAMPGVQVHFSEVHSSGTTISLTMNQGDVAGLAEIDAVQFVEEAFEITLRNSTNRWVVQTGVSNNTPLYDNGIHGEGEIVGILDGRVDADHCSFDDSNPIGPAHRKIQAYNATDGSDDHGTHVAGTCVGDAGTSGDTRGVAYEGRLVCDTIPSFTESGIVNALEQHANQGAAVHTNSWGDDGTTQYNTLARGFDVFCRDNETQFVCLAVTNTSTLRNPENAKNLMAVGASQDTPNLNSHCSGGVGPTSDSRRKPEIYAPGCSTVSSDGNTSCSTRSLTGTSMACPAIAGTAMLVRQYYRDGFYPSGIANPSDAKSPTGALVKATLLNSAVDMTGVSGYPSNLEGWGRVRASDALFFDGDGRKLFIHDQTNRFGMSTGEMQTFPISIDSAGEALRVTMAFTDVPGTAGTSFAPVNDMDLEVISPTGTVYRGNVFSGGFSATGGSFDIRNNVEQVHVASPQAGTWTVNVHASAVNSGVQGFALVVTGDLTPQPGAANITLASAVPTVMEPGMGATFDVTINPGDDTIVGGSEQLFYSYDGGAFTSVALTPLGGDTFRATLPAPECADMPAFYVSAEGVSTGVLTLPVGAPGNSFGAIVGQEAVAFEDDIESDQGWSVGAAADDATTGVWTRVNPVGTSAQPEDDHTASGTVCWVTGQGSVGGGLGDNDVDGGQTTLTTPTLMLSGSGSAEISYWRWYSNDQGGSPNADVFVVDISDNGGSSWTNVETVGPSGEGTGGGWVQHTFLVEDFVSLTDQVVLRFIASDEGSGSIVEAGVDDFAVTTFECEDITPMECPGDATGDNMVNFDDLNIVLGAWGTAGPAGDVAPLGGGDGMVNFDDLNLVLANWLQSCP